MSRDSSSYAARDGQYSLFPREMEEPTGCRYDQQYANEEAACAPRGPNAGSEELIRVGIYDRGSPDGRYHAIEKKNALLNALSNMMYSELISDSNIKPRFNWSDIVEGVFRTVAVGERSAEFLRDGVKEMRPPWPGARLYVDYKSNKKFNVEAYVPGPFISVRVLYDVLRGSDRRFQTTKWQDLGVRRHNQGHVFTFSIDGDSFKALEDCNGFVGYYDAGIEFRVLRD